MIYLKKKEAAMNITKELFGETSKGAAHLFTLERGGLRASFTDFGCALQSLVVSGRGGRPVDVVLGYDAAASYEAGGGSFGAFVGRYANRIKGAEFELDGEVYRLSKNNGENHLHGNYSKELYEAETDGDALVFRRLSPAGEEGYPGALMLEVRYFIDDDSGLHMVYTAETDAPTVLNLTNHSYFNLAGEGDALDHELRLLCGSFTETGPGTVPTGRVLEASGTPLDFSEWKAVGRDIGADYEQLTLCGGYDHNYIIGGEAGTLKSFAWLRCERSGICMEVSTTQPAVQLYSGNHTDGANIPLGKGGVRYPKHAGICLETQNYPCAPNFPQFPSAVLRPGEIYRHETVYSFSV